MVPVPEIVSEMGEEGQKEEVQEEVPASASATDATAAPEETTPASTPAPEGRGFGEWRRRYLNLRDILDILREKVYDYYRRYAIIFQNMERDMRSPFRDYVEAIVTDPRSWLETFPQSDTALGALVKSKTAMMYLLSHERVRNELTPEYCDAAAVKLAAAWGEHKSALAASRIRSFAQPQGQPQAQPQAQSQASQISQVSKISALRREPCVLADNDAENDDEVSSTAATGPRKTTNTTNPKLYRVVGGDDDEDEEQDGGREAGGEVDEDEATVRQRVLMSSDPDAPQRTDAQSRDTIAEYARYTEYLKAVIESRDGDLAAMQKRLTMLTNLVFMLAADASPSGDRLVGYLSVLLT